MAKLCDAAYEELPVDIGLRRTKAPMEINSGVEDENSMAWVTDVCCIACTIEIVTLGLYEQYVHT